MDGTSTVDIINGDVFFEIIDPVELEYTYRIRPAKDFGAPFVSTILYLQLFFLTCSYHGFIFTECFISYKKCSISACTS